MSNQNTVTVLNPDDVANALKTQASVDGVNIQSITATTSGNVKKDDVLTVNITATGYKDAMTGGNTSQITISANQTYSIVATATTKSASTKGVTIDVNTIQVTSIKQIYGNG